MDGTFVSLTLKLDNLCRYIAIINIGFLLVKLLSNEQVYIQKKYGDHKEKKSNFCLRYIILGIERLCHVVSS